MSSNSDSSRDVGKDPNDVTDSEREESKEDVETMNKFKELLAKVESGFRAFMSALLEKFGLQLSGTLKCSLECSVCKEFIIEAFSRPCAHTFCYHCLDHWIENSNDCPICRNEVRLAFKNPLIDEVIQLVVDLSFTEDEKKERSSIIQQRLSSSFTVDKEPSTNQMIGKILEPRNVDSIVFGRAVSSNKARLFFEEIVQELLEQTKDSDQNVFVDDLLNNLFISLSNDLVSMSLFLKNVPSSWGRRYLGLEY